MLNLKFIFTNAFVISLAGLIGFIWIAVLIGDERIEAFDSSFISLIQGAESETLTTIMKFFTTIGSTLAVAVLAVLMLIVLARFHSKRELFLFIGVMAGSTLLNVALKTLFQRVRPTVHRIIEANGYSFPSGHSMAAFTLYGIFAFLLWKHIPSFYIRLLLIAAFTVMIIAIGSSRIYLGVHYPSDIIGGYLASGTWLAATIGLYQSITARRSRKLK